MIVCQCYGTTDREIAGVVQKGAASCAADVRRTCGAGKGCGGCHPTIARILQTLGVDRKRPAPAPRR